MLVEKILRFFASVDATHTMAEIDSIKEFNTQTDSPSHINRKKTAQTWVTMSNSFPPNTSFWGKIVQIVSENRHTGLYSNIYDNVDQLIQNITTSIWDQQWNHISVVSIPRLPSFQNFFQQKTIIISDFLWSDKQINECLLWCKSNKVRCIVIPLITDMGTKKHPLQEKYPDYFRSL